MNNVNIVDMLNIVDGDNLDANLEDKGFVISKKAPEFTLRGIVMDTLLSMDMYHEESCTLEEDDNYYIDEQLDSVIQLITSFGAAGGSDKLYKTVWFE